jgi:transcriptional regulator with AAA-type ATPase domain
MHKSVHYLPAMTLMSDREHTLARAISRLAGANPFLPERVEAEREALGPDFVEAGAAWHARVRPDAYPNLAALDQRASLLAGALRRKLAAGTQAQGDEALLYEDLVLYVLSTRYLPALQSLVDEPRKATAPVAAYTPFAQDVAHYLDLPGLNPAPEKRPERPAPPGLPTRIDPAHLWALFFQVRRAFHATFTHILGGSLPAARLRAAVWQSIFTHDARRYRRGLHARMHDLTTLITGPSGTGKELVAQAIGAARYVPFDPARRAFAEDFTASFYPLHLAGLPATLVESELFGHRRGAFIGAVQDRAGWLETCPALGTVFLDEIGELEPALQVKLLRVLQARAFHRIGETRARSFGGKLIAATNRNLALEIDAGRFREDLFHRLCDDVIETPSLAAQLHDSPGELGHLLRVLAARVAGEEEAEALAAEAEGWIGRHLGPGYAWPGNVRELEQCLRNVMVRGEYRPRRAAPVSGPDDLAAAIQAGALTADELLRRYSTLVFARTGSYEEAARRLGLDRRTVKAKVDSGMLDALRAGGGEGRRNQGRDD